MDYGHFSQDGSEYVITRFPTPRPWENHLGNDRYGVRVEETGAGHSVLPVAPGCRVTFSAPGEPFGKVFFLRDAEANRHWSLTWQPVGGPHERFRCRHGLGYTIFELTREGIESQLRVFVPPDGPVEIWTATVRNTGDRFRRLTLFPYVEWHLAPHLSPWDNYRNYIAAHWSEEEAFIVAEMNDPAHPGNSFVGFAGVDPPATGCDTDRAAFLGDGSMVAPAAVVEGACLGSDMPGDGRAVAAFQLDLELAPGAETTATLLVGFSADPVERRGLREAYLGAKKAETAFGRLRDQWGALARQPHIETPEPRLDRMANLWLKTNVRQLTQGVREGLRGYRDTLQDAMGIVSFDAGTARRRIVEALAHQYADGHALRQFAYNGAPHDLRVYNDSPVWLVLAVARYLKETGDFAFLDQTAPFFGSPEAASVFDHLRRAVEWLGERRGHHGLIRIDRGDWCDALDEVGREGVGVSLWLSQAFHLMLLEFAEICRLRNDEALERRSRETAVELRERIERHGWDGEWYLCAISDRGRRLGARGESTMEMYLNPQSWAAIGQAGSPERVVRALDSAAQRLDSPFGPLLLDPPYLQYDPDVGRLSVLRLGCGENGTVYVHAAVFFVLANLMAGRPDQAMDALCRVAPMMERHDPAITWAAPYSFVNSYVGPQHPAHAGRTITNWYTSSASWALIAITDWLLGVRPTYRGLLIDPCLPSGWERARLRREWRGATYDVTIAKPKGITGGTVRVAADGEPLPGAIVPAYGDGREHEIQVEVAAR